MQTENHNNGAARAAGQITVNSIALRIGKSKRVVSVDSFEQASDAFLRLLTESNRGGTRAPSATIVDLTTGNTIASISPNGRVWEGEKIGGKEIRLGDEKTAAEHQAENLAD